MQNTAPIDNTIYDTLGDRWYTAYDDPVALLRAESKVKLPWVLSHIKAHFSDVTQVRHLDIGCGAGFLSNPLGAANLKVTGLDLSEQSLAVAAKHDESQKVNYIKGDAYQLPFSDETFDTVSAMDFLEHVEDPARAIREISRVLKPGGLFFFHTFNRNWLAHFVIIQLVHWLVKNTPKHMHVIHLFITPKELEKMSAAANLVVKAMTGIRPRLLTLSLGALRSGVVPKDFAFKLTRSLKLSYMGYAQKAQQPRTE